LLNLGPSIYLNADATEDPIDAYHGDQIPKKTPLANIKIIFAQAIEDVHVTDVSHPAMDFVCSPSKTEEALNASAISYTKATSAL